LIGRGRRRGVGAGRTGRGFRRRRLLLRMRRGLRHGEGRYTQGCGRNQYPQAAGSRQDSDAGYFHGAKDTPVQVANASTNLTVRGRRA